MGSIATEFKNPHTVDLPVNRFHRRESIDTDATAKEFLGRFSDALKSDDLSALSSVIHEESWWRDALAMGSWDLRTLHGLPKVKQYLKNYPVRSSVHNFHLTKSFKPALVSPIPGLEWLEFSIGFDTEIARVAGMLRLTQDQDGIWKAFIIYTAVDELKGFEEITGARRPHGGRNTVLDSGFKGNWKERRERQKEFLDKEPQVLIIGAGQAGLAIAARLQALQVTSLIIDRNERVGDNWRQRYRTLSTHDPVYICDMPYLPFPSTWSFYSPKDKLADFLETYATLLELNVWTSTNLITSSYDRAASQWTASLKRPDGSVRTVKPCHVIFSTGHSGEPQIPTFPGQQGFKGTMYHGSQHSDASKLGDVTGKKVLVVGTGNSGHDIAQNFYEHGADVTMIQRRPTYVITADPGIQYQNGTMYGEDGIPVEDADFYGQSFPIPVNFRLKVDVVKQIAELDKDIRYGLTKAGFALTMGEDGGGIWRDYLTRGGGYYIDIGASQLIVDSKIKVVQSKDGIKNFESDKMVLANGKELPAEIVVLATGYENMRTSVRKALGDRVADQCKDVWNLDEEGEINAMWRESGHPGLWYMGGNLLLCRIYSKFLALQIKAIEEGLKKQA